MQQLFVFGFICIFGAISCLAFYDPSISYTWGEKRSDNPDNPERSDPYNNPDYYIALQYDEYPMIVPRKRTAIFLDRVMMALQKVMDEEEKAAAAAAASAVADKTSSASDIKSRTKSRGPEALRSVSII